MKNENIYKSWRDNLLSLISEQICTPCTDERKEQYTLNFDNPLVCGCRCDRVVDILDNARKIDDDIKKYSNENNE